MLVHQSRAVKKAISSTGMSFAEWKAVPNDSIRKEHTYREVICKSRTSQLDRNKWKRYFRNVITFHKTYLRVFAVTQYGCLSE